MDAECVIEYETDGIVCSHAFDASGALRGGKTDLPFSDLALMFDVRRKEIGASDAVGEQPEEVVTFSIVATVCRKLRLKAFTLTLHLKIGEDSRILLNGYQSWTDTRLRRADETMRGLSGIPRAVVDRFTLDGSGDYRFASYPSGRGHQHGWTYGYVLGGGWCRLVGSLDETRGFTELRFALDSDSLTIAPEVPAREIDANEHVVLATGALVSLRGETDDVVDRAFGHWACAAGIRRRPARPLVGYTSWYRHYGDVDEAKLLGDLRGAKAALDRLDTSGFTPLFQLDDGYARKVGDWLDVDEGKFPRGLKAVAEDIRAAGFMPGIWMAPFSCERQSRLAREHPDWLMRDEGGAPIGTGSHWSGALALDTRNPGVRDYVRKAIRTATQEWGFQLLKLDFLFAACMVPHDGMNRGELMADGISLLREAAGDGVLIDGCGVPLSSVFGAFEYCRIGCDVGLDWDGSPIMRNTERERVSTKNSLANTVYRAPLCGRAFLNDPDVLLLRDDVALTPEQRDMVLGGDACFGGMLLTSDDMGAWTDGQLESFQAAIDLMRAASADREARNCDGRVAFDGEGCER